MVYAMIHTVTIAVGNKLIPILHSKIPDSLSCNFKPLQNPGNTTLLANFRVVPGTMNQEDISSNNDNKLLLAVNIAERTSVFMNVSLRSSSFSADNLGIWASALCVVHCVVTPVLISMSVLLARLIPGEERTHRALAMGDCGAGRNCAATRFRIHGRWRVLGLMVLGLGFIFAGAFFAAWLPSHGYEVAVTMTGSVLMICAHRMNHTFCRDCERCTRRSMQPTAATMAKDAQKVATGGHGCSRFD